MIPGMIESLPYSCHSVEGCTNERLRMSQGPSTHPKGVSRRWRCAKPKTLPYPRQNQTLTWRTLDLAKSSI